MRSGTEIVTRDLAIGMRRRGHDVDVYTGQTGGLTEELAAAGVNIYTDPDSVPVPDVFHVNHMGFARPLMELHKSVPVLVQCHDATHGNAALFNSDQVKLWSGVSQACRTRVGLETGVPLEAVRFLPNCVETDHLPELRQKMPIFPRRWLFVGEKPGGKRLERRLRLAAALFATRLDIVGPFVSAPDIVDDLASHAASYDLVFASARCALESAAAGTGVIVCDPRGLAGFLGREQWGHWGPHNLGLGCMDKSPNLANLIGSVLAWRRSEVHAVSHAIRRGRSLAELLQQLEQSYLHILGQGPAPSNIFEPSDRSSQ